MARDGIPFVAIPLLIAILFLYSGSVAGFALLFIIAAFMAFFFRDPKRNVPEEPDLVVSAADGKVTRIEKTDEGFLVSVFLSPLDVHINRAPIGGQITGIRRFKGRKRPATSDRASSTNERNAVTISDGNVTVICTQIVGILARRIVCRLRIDDTVERGERFGLIRFGSRTDLLLPEGVRIAVEVGDKVRGGETVIARITDRVESV